MAVSWRCLSVTGLLLFALLGSGCNIMALPFFLIPGMEPKIEAKCKLADDDKERIVRVAILASSGLETRPEFIHIDRELSRLLAQQLREAVKKNKENVQLVSISQVERFKDEHADWRSKSPEEIGKYFNADKVINLEIESITLYEQGSSNTLFRGRAAISLDVMDISKAAEGPIYKEVYTIEYPRARGPIPAENSNPAQFRQQFLNVIARELCWRFTSHLVDDDLRCD